MSRRRDELINAMSHTSRAECDVDGWRWYCGHCGTWAETPTRTYEPTRDAGRAHVESHGVRLAPLRAR